MQTLVFNTAAKTVEVFSSLESESSGQAVLKFVNIPTVRPKDGYYEVIRKDHLDDATAYPVARFPISNTNMLIEK